MVHSSKCRKIYIDKDGKEVEYYCFGVLYSCGHSFDCIVSDEAMAHNHNLSAMINVVLGTAAFGIVFLFLIFHKGL